MKQKSAVHAVVTGTLCLITICLIVTFAVAGTRFVFKDQIAEQEWLKKQEVMKTLVKADTYDAVSNEEEQQVYRALDASGNIAGYIFVTEAYGYGSMVSVMSGISDGQIVGIDVLDCSNETPGLGQNVAKESFEGQFSGLKSTPEITKSAPETDNQIETVTGATKSSAAVAQSVEAAMTLYDSVAVQETEK